MFRTGFFLIIFFLGLQIVNSSSFALSIKESEVELSILINRIIQEDNFEEKNKLNSQLIGKFYDVLNMEGAFDYPFDSLTNIGILKSSDNKIRFFTWNVPQEGGLQRYFGFIQVNLNGNILIYPLTDNRDAFEQPQLETSTADKWFGALYYHLNEVNSNGETLYTLLGADLNDMFSTRRIIEVVKIKNDGEPTFGQPIFKVRNQIISRVIFEYSARANMVLRWADDLNMIVFDHLVPLNPSFVGNYQFYVPDMSYDGFQFTDSYWVYVTDIDARNPRRERPPRPEAPDEDIPEPGFLYQPKKQEKKE